MLENYKKTLTGRCKLTTLTFLLQGNSVLLGHKKTGFGKGYYLGIGGKVEGEESIEEGAVRELAEEVSVQLNPADLNKMGVLKFYFPHIADESWNHEVHVFLATIWRGNPKESVEMKPEWFEISNLPIDKMWDDAKLWLPKVLGNQTVNAEFMFDKNLRIVEHQDFEWVSSF